MRLAHGGLTEGSVVAAVAPAHLDRIPDPNGGEVRPSNQGMNP